MFFENRREASKILATKLLDDPLVSCADRDDLLVLSIPRGGVVVGDIVARTLGCAHDVIVVKKIGFPGHEELAIGAVAENDLVVLDDHATGWYSVEDDDLADEIAQVKARVAGHIQKFRHGRTLATRSKFVIVVDDGVATGETIRAAVKWLKLRDETRSPQKVIVAVPVKVPFAPI